MTEKEIIKKYGEPGDDNLVTIDLPYPMRIAWDTKKTITKMRCHKLVKDKFLAVFKELLETYGLPKLQELGIDLYGGCYNFRLMRGSKKTWSRHSWGIAIDLDPSRNGLKVKSPAAQFSKPEYKPMIDIFYKHGFLSYGVEKNFDWMHFEAKE